MALSMKQLDERITDLEGEIKWLKDNVANLWLGGGKNSERITELVEKSERTDDHIRQIELDESRPQGTPEYVNELLVAVISSLYQQRSQGSYKMAKELENKYFNGVDVRAYGDRVTEAGDLLSATVTEEK